MARSRRKTREEAAAAWGAKEPSRRLKRPGGPAGPYRGQSSVPSIRHGGSSKSIVPYNPPTPAAGATTSSVSAPSGSSSGRRRSGSRSSDSPPLVLVELADLITPGPTAKERAEAAHRLGVKPQQDGRLAKLATDLIGPAMGRVVSKLEGEGKQAAQTIVKAAALPQALHESPKQVAGHKTLGTPTLGQVVKAGRKGNLRVNRRGKVTIPATRKAARGLKSARQHYRRTASPDLSGLSPAERSVAPIVRKASKRYGIPPSVLMSQISQESGFDPSAVSSAGAFGLSQFIPSTAASYGVQRGTSRKAQRSQVFGQAHYLSDLGFNQNPQQALSSYSGGYAASRYNNPILQGSRRYTALDKPSKPTPEAAARLRRAKAGARRLGIPTKPASPADRFGPPDKQVLTRFNAAQQAAKELEKAKLPYVWGGGHGSPTSSPTGGGLDCSGAVSYVLNKMGALKGSLVSGDMGKALEPGPGAVTVFYNGGHTFMKIGNRYFGTSRTNPQGGAGFIPANVAGSEAASGKYRVGHVPGLGGKVAIQLGVDVSGGAPSSGGGGGGIVYSQDGTTATVTEGTTKGKPGFSDKPITASLSSILTPGAAGAPLPAAYRQFQLGEAPEEGGQGGGYIAQLLRRKRL